MSPLALVIALADPTPHLFNPRPEEDLRELASERPDVVESARTVDAGHVQAEIEILGTELDGLIRNREPTASLQGASVILRLGLSPRWEFQVHTPRLQLLWPDRSQADRYDVGAGDASLRFKWNLIGNDDGRFALALLPLVRWREPNYRVQGGLYVPMRVELHEKVQLGLMAGIEAVRYPDSGYDAEVRLAASLQFEIVGPLQMFTEVASFVSTLDPDGSALLTNAGLLVTIGDNAQFDVAALGAPLGDEEPELTLTMGLTLRR